MSDWHSVHVHYYDDQGVDDLILDAVRPLFARLADHIRTAYFVRHWRRGPHLRLNVASDAGRFAATVTPLVDDVVGGYLAARPSQATPDPERLLPMHQRLAELEREPGPLLPWRADNSWHVEPYDRRLDVLGGECAADLLARYLADTTDLIFQMTDHVRSGGNRVRLAFDLMVAVAHACSGSAVTRGFVSYRSHSEGFLFEQPDGERVRAGWDDQYRRSAGRLADRVRSVVATLDGESDGGGPEVPFVLSWVSALAPYQARAERLIETGEISMRQGWTSRSAERRDDGPFARLSPFHRRLLANESFLRAVAPSTEFAAYRLMLNYNYLQLTRLGVTPVERYWLGHMVANAVEECYGCSAFDLIGREYEAPATRGQS